MSDGNKMASWVRPHVENSPALVTLGAVPTPTLLRMISGARYSGVPQSVQVLRLKISVDEIQRVKVFKGSLIHDLSFPYESTLVRSAAPAHPRKRVKSRYQRPLPFL
ncbi:hypothetical protein EYF80_019369 [Liparis tanakae]|uniref:Uncharacterized protein n=1 Tax=Liparis tanakae TaxID=230148 RepID=A0A4Z2HZF0_9TELE|nr:hypothetical protein EYF80_019369 [Liparis tanakae]